jgi:alkylated DNA repair dioxygenase AlkB
MKEEEEIKKTKKPNGLYYIKDFIQDEYSKEIINYLDSNKCMWSNELNRRTQQYGYKFNYTTRKADEKVTPVPKIFDKLLNNISVTLKNLGDYEDGFDQIIVNEYNWKQGISPHIDNPEYFGGIIITISLLYPSPIIFKEIVKEDDGKLIDTGYSYEIILEKNSVAILSGDARYKWKHAIPTVKSFLIENKEYIKDENYRRISLTFRKMNIDKLIKD